MVLKVLFITNYYLFTYLANVNLQKKIVWWLDLLYSAVPLSMKFISLWVFPSRVQQNDRELCMASHTQFAECTTNQFNNQLQDGWLQLYVSSFQLKQYCTSIIANVRVRIPESVIFFRLSIRYYVRCVFQYCEDSSLNLFCRSRLSTYFY